MHFSFGFLTKTTLLSLSCVNHNPSLPLGWKSRDSVPKLVEEYLAGQLKVDEFLTHTMPLADINKAFDLMHQGERYLGVTLLNTLLLTRSLFSPPQHSYSCSLLKTNVLAAQNFE